jgi:hypothetical protein
MSQESGSKNLFISSLQRCKNPNQYTSVFARMQSPPENGILIHAEICSFYREVNGSEDVFRTKYRKAEGCPELWGYSVDKCPPQEYNSELLLTKHEYYTHGGCIYE